MQFEEQQYFRQPWMWAILLFVVLTPIVAVVMAGSSGTAEASRALYLTLPLVLLGDLLLLLVFWKMNLCTRVDHDGLSVQFFPFHWKPKRIPLEKVKSFAAVQYSPLRDYGGWGIKYGRKGKAYNVSGNRGVRLEFEQGKPLLVGSQQPELLARAIQQYIDVQSMRRTSDAGPLGGCAR